MNDIIYKYNAKLKHTKKKVHLLSR